jgi:hypothetical protein
VVNVVKMELSVGCKNVYLVVVYKFCCKICVWFTFFVYRRPFGVDPVL